MEFLEPLYNRSNNNNNYTDPSVTNPRLEQLQSVVRIALPLIPIPEPIRRTMYSAIEISRTIDSLFSLNGACKEGSKELIKISLIRTAFSTTIAVSTIFGSPLASMITTAQTMVAHSKELIKALENKDYKKALILSTEIVSNSLYLSLFFTGSSQIMIASLALQILLGTINSIQDFQNEKYIEAFGNLIGVLIRGNQLKIEIAVFQLQRAIDQHLADVENLAAKINETQADVAQINIDQTQVFENNILKSKIEKIDVKIASNDYDLKNKAEEFFKNSEVMKKQMPDCDLTKILGRSPRDKEVIDVFLSKHPGFCVGENHTHDAARAFLINNMDYLKQKNVKVLFAEGWRHEEQDTINKYFSMRHLRELNSSDRLKIESLLNFSKNGLINKPNSPYTAFALLEKSKKAGIRLVGIDYHQSSYELGELRLKKMNFVAFKVVEAYRKAFKEGDKFVGWMGAAHLRSLYSEYVHGVADLTETPAIWLQDKPSFFDRVKSDLQYEKWNYSSLPVNVLYRESYC